MVALRTIRRYGYARLLTAFLPLLGLATLLLFMLLLGQLLLLGRLLLLGGGLRENIRKFIHVYIERNRFSVYMHIQLGSN